MSITSASSDVSSHVKKLFDHWRRRIFALTWLCYFGLYLTRKSYSVAKGSLDIDIDETMMGAIDSAYLAAYAIGQFVMGATADKSGPRKVLLGGLLASIICSIVMGLTGFASAFLIIMFISSLICISYFLNIIFILIS